MIPDTDFTTLQQVRSICGPVFTVGERVRVSALEPDEEQPIHVGDTGTIRLIERDGPADDEVADDYLTVALDRGIRAVLFPHEVEHFLA